MICKRLSSFSSFFCCHSWAGTKLSHSEYDGGKNKGPGGRHVSHIISTEEINCQSWSACGQGGGASPSHEPAGCLAGRRIQEVTGSHSGHCVAPCRGWVTMEIRFSCTGEWDVCISCMEISLLSVVVGGSLLTTWLQENWSDSQRLHVW